MADTRPVRAGEELDVVALDACFATHAGVVGRVSGVEQFAGGFSNLTYLLNTDRGEFVLRRPPRGVGKGSAHDMVREYRMLSALSGRGVPVPKPVMLCESDSVIGAPFYVMERVHGVILRATPREVPPPDVMRRLSASFVDTLVTIHAVDIYDPAIAALGKPEGYLGRQVAGWVRRWEAARTGDVPPMDWLTAWFPDHRPAERGAALIHNDFKYDNLVLDPGDLSCVRAVLDWEMATLGDPLLDVGTSLGYWLEAGDPPAFRSLGLGATALPGNYTRREIWERYLERSGRASTDPLFYYVFGLFKIAVIAQQIFARFQQGLTTDPRFARLGEAVQLLAVTARRAAERGSISPSLSATS